MKRLIVVGDSDIAFWPKELLPFASDNALGAKERRTTEWGEPLVSGHSGATLAGVLPHLRRVLSAADTVNNTISGETRIVVACAGENDIGEGLSLDKSLEALREFLDAIFLNGASANGNVLLIFLGPKFEPWLEHDPSYKKQYTAMAMAFRRCLQEYETTITTTTRSTASEGNEIGNHNSSGRIHFVDCLTMFCGETANLPGARLGGRAKADPRFFASDELHLNKEGYQLWKEVVEDRIRHCLT